MSKSVLITIATEADEAAALRPLVAKALRSYLEKLEAGELGEQPEEILLVEPGLGMRIERADTATVAAYLEAIRAFCREQGGAANDPKKH